MSWRDEAVCRSIQGDFWWPEQGEASVLVKRICRSCPVQEPCLEEALVNYETGIWGGTSDRQRRDIRRARRVA